MLKIFLSNTLLILFFSLSVFAQDSVNTNNQTIKIGLKETPPFVVSENGKYSGLSIRSWEMINEKVGLDYEYVIFDTLDKLLKAIETGEVDMSINPVTVTTKRMERMDFSQPYFISETVAAKKSDSNFMYILQNVFSWNFMKAILILVGVILLFGVLVWFFERKKNEEEFGGVLKGISQGFWWSAVTMTTVGYGDKSPKTLGGRIVGFIWMFAAIILISSLTAGIASSLTFKSLQGAIQNINDLDKFKVVTVAQSSAEELLNQYNINSEKVNFLSDAVEMVSKNEADVIIYDKPILTYALEKSGDKDKILLSERSLKKDYYSYSFPKKSALYTLIDTNLVDLLKTTEWNTVIDKY